MFVKQPELPKDSPLKVPTRLWGNQTLSVLSWIYLEHLNVCKYPGKIQIFQADWTKGTQTWSMVHNGLWGKFPL